MTIIRQWEGMNLLFSLCFCLAFKHAATIMSGYRFAIKPMFLSSASHQINKCTMQQQLFRTSNSLHCKFEFFIKNLTSQDFYSFIFAVFFPVCNVC